VEEIPHIPCDILSQSVNEKVQEIAQLPGGKGLETDETV